jgi:O-antigen/teichoic acid export membrane protein
LRGFLEASFQFRFLNLMQLLMGIYTFLSPIVAWLIEPSLSMIMIFVVSGRFVFLIFHLLYLFSGWRWLFKSTNLKTKEISQRIRKLSGWLTVGNIIGPFMTYFDRFILGSFIPMVQVAYYTTPYEFVSRLYILPMSLVRVLFPEFAKYLVFEKSKLKQVYRLSLYLIFVVMMLPCAGLIYFGYDGLKIWLGDDFANSSYQILQILSVGVFFNGLSHVPYTLIQSTEKVDWTAKVHMIELPIYLLGLWFMATKFGLIGVAIAWSARVIFDELILSILVNYATQIRLHSLLLKLKIYLLSLFCFGFGFMNLSTNIKLIVFSVLVFSGIFYLYTMRRNFFTDEN